MASAISTLSTSNIGKYQPIYKNNMYIDNNISAYDFDLMGGKMKCGLCNTDHVYNTVAGMNKHLKSNKHKNCLEIMNLNTQALPISTNNSPYVKIHSIHKESNTQSPTSVHASPVSNIFPTYSPSLGIDNLYHDAPLSKKEFQKVCGGTYGMTCSICNSSRVFYRAANLNIHIKSDKHKHNLQVKNTQIKTKCTVDSEIDEVKRLIKIIQTKDKQLAQLKQAIINIGEYLKNM